MRTILLLTLTLGLAHSASGAAPSLPANAPLWASDLSGPHWQMEGIRPGQGIEEGFHLHFGEVGGSTLNWNAASVPGDVYTDLWRAGEIDDPHFGRNGLRAKWAMEREWWYRCTFKVPEHQQGKNFRLIFEGVDYACDVWLNGQHLGDHEGMFSSFEFEVSDELRIGASAGDNGLVVRLAPPPRLYRNVAGRKFGWHGDYWRTLTPMGIWKPVRIVATGPSHISNVHPTSRLQPNGAAAVTVDVEFAGKAIPNGSRLHTTVRGFNCTSETVETTIDVGPTHSGQAQLQLEIPEAKLWWPWDMGKPNLYLAETTLLGPDGDVWDRSSTRFAIRELQMKRNPGYSEEEVMHAWTPVINGKAIFLRSANWGGPPDIFYGRNSEDRYRHLLELARGPWPSRS